MTNGNTNDKLEVSILWVGLAFGVLSTLITPLTVLANNTKPVSAMFYVAFTIGLFGLVFAVVNIAMAAVHSKLQRLPVSIITFVLALFGISIAMVGMIKYTM